SPFCRRTLFCALCGQRFSSSKGFFSHQLKHRKQEHEQKVFQCFCGRSFRTMSGLGTHQRFSTSCSEGKVKEEIKHPFVCSECGKTFGSSVALLCHQRAVNLTCTECGIFFKQETELHQHYIEHARGL
uniref:C2H2-type domain-containing protein n=1 Tax=Sinocyclocheilus rhinocerous TaxID=307959 RepID=A0A673JIB6_9TELE